MCQIFVRTNNNKKKKECAAILGPLMIEWQRRIWRRSHVKGDCGYHFSNCIPISTSEFPRVFIHHICNMHRVRVSQAGYSKERGKKRGIQKSGRGRVIHFPACKYVFRVFPPLYYPFFYAYPWCEKNMNKNITSTVALNFGRVYKDNLTCEEWAPEVGN